MKKSLILAALLILSSSCNKTFDVKRGDFDDPFTGKRCYVIEQHIDANGQRFSKYQCEAIPGASPIPQPKPPTCQERPDLCWTDSIPMPPMPSPSPAP